MSKPVSSLSKARLPRIRLFLCDVDGVLTDGWDLSSLALPGQRG
jgi:hypothetical protein